MGLGDHVHLHVRSVTVGSCHCLPQLSHSIDIPIFKGLRDLRTRLTAPYPPILSRTSPNVHLASNRRHEPAPKERAVGTCQAASPAADPPPRDHSSRAQLSTTTTTGCHIHRMLHWANLP